jgi:YD repeat-containing protein
MVTLLQKFIQKKNDRKDKNPSSLALLVLFSVLSSAIYPNVIWADEDYAPGYFWHRNDNRKAKTPTQLYDNIYNGIYPYTRSNSWGTTVHSYEGSWISSGNPQTDNYVLVTTRVKSSGWQGISYFEAIDGALKSECTTIWKDYWFCDGIPPGVEPDHKQSPSCSSSNPVVSDPIVVATGNSFQTEVDYQSQTPFGLSFVRFYNSSSFAVDKGMGKKWRHGFNRTIKLVGTQAQVARSNGQTFLFNFDGNVWVGDVDVPDTLIETIDTNNVRTGWVYTDSRDNVETFNTTGQVLSLTNRAGQSKTFVYDVAVDGGDDNSETLDKVTGFSGEEMLFAYDSEQRISSMTDPERNSYSYNYDAVGNLTSVTYPDNTPLDSLDNPTRFYHYENTSFPSHLTGLTDETGSRVTWDFDEEGRAISSELDGGVDKSTLDFSVTDQVTVTNPLGKDTTYHFTNLHDVKKVTQVEGHATASCAGANQHYTYDANGYIESKTDWQGNVTTYVHNERGLETSRVEAFGTSEARTITTQWHDEFRLPIKITSAGQVTDFVYNDKGRFTSQTTHDVQ